MPTWSRDVRFALRLLWKNPAFTGVAVLSTALAIGANTTIFSLISAVLLQPLPVERPDRIVLVYTSDYSGPAYGGSSYPDFVDFRERTDVFSGLVATSMQAFSFSDGERTDQVYGEIVSPDYFAVLGVHHSLGRAFGDEPAVVLSHGFWRRRFAGDPSTVGRTVTINGQALTVAGVAPHGFAGAYPLFASEFWVPITLQPRFEFGRSRLAERSARWLMLLGRLRPDRSPQEAQAAFTVLAAQLQKTYPEAWTDVRRHTRRITALRERDARVPPQMRNDIFGFLGLLAAVVALVLLVACANLATLQLARGSARRKEIAIRLSLGAGRLQIVRQLTTESVVLALAGGIAGLLTTFWLLPLLIAFKPPIALPIVLQPKLDGTVLGFTAGLSILTGLLFGLAPALEVSRGDLVPSLKQDTAGAAGYRRSRLRSGFIVAEVGLSLLLLVGAGLFLRSLRNATAIDPGFDATNVSVFSFNLRLAGYSQERGRQFLIDVVERARALPGVASASVASSVPLSLYGSRRGTLVEGYTRQPGEDLEFHYNVVGPEFLELLKIPIVVGRGFTPQDRAGAPGVVVVNETFARRFWRGETALGKRLSVTGPSGRMLEVVGVARDGKYNTLGEDPTPFLYLPALQIHESSMTLFVRTAADPGSILPAVRRELQQLDRNLPVTEVKTLEEHLGITLFPARVAAALLGAFGLVALLLAAIGIYGVMSYAVSQRTREMGIRVALGARPQDLIRLVVGQGMALAGAGLALGIVAALALTRFVSSLLYGVGTRDPVTFSLVPLVLLSVAFVASYLPAWRAARVDPLVALRYE